MKKQLLKYMLAILILGMLGCQTSSPTPSKYEVDTEMVDNPKSHLLPILIRPESIQIPSVNWKSLYLHQSLTGSNNNNPFSEQASSTIQGAVPGEQADGVFVFVVHRIYLYSDETHTLKGIADFQAKDMGQLGLKLSDLDLTFDHKEVVVGCKTHNNGVETCLALFRYPKLFSYFSLSFSKAQNDRLAKDILFFVTEKINKDITVQFTQ